MKDFLANLMLRSLRAHRWLSLNLDSRFIHDIRIQRWGHSLPLAKTNFFSSNDYQLVNHSFTNRIHFANQDKYINPAFESAFAAAESINL